MKTTLKTAKFTLKTAFARCVTAKILCCGGGFMIDCGMFCRACGGFNVFFRRLQGLFAAKMRCENGKSIVRKRWFGFAISVEIHCVTAVAWCVSGVSNTDFTNFKKHSTVLTSILQQINTLYQHFQSVKTAKPALEQAKTMLKIALPTFKNDENHTQNSKIHIQNSVCEVRCGENSVLWRRFHD